jgi:hypothetical protein
MNSNGIVQVGSQLQRLYVPLKTAAAVATASWLTPTRLWTAESAVHPMLHVQNPTKGCHLRCKPIAARAGLLDDFPAYLAKHAWCAPVFHAVLISQLSSRSGKALTQQNLNPG